MSARTTFNFSRLIEALGAGKSAEQSGSLQLSLTIAVDLDAPANLVCWIRDAFIAEGPMATVEVTALDRASSNLRQKTDAVLIIVGSHVDLCTQLVSSFLYRSVPVALVGLHNEDIAGFSEQSEEAELEVGRIAAPTRIALEKKLSRWLLDATDKPIAFAANFPFMRRPLVESLTMKCAVENAAVGAIDLIHGSDLPIMLANQMKLAFRVSAAYGERLSMDQLTDAAVILSLAYGSRGLYRLLSTMLPSQASWLLRALMAFISTQLTGSILVGRRTEDKKELLECLEEKKASFANQVLAIRNEISHEKVQTKLDDRRLYIDYES